MTKNEMKMGNIVIKKNSVFNVKNFAKISVLTLVIMLGFNSAEQNTVAMAEGQVAAVKKDSKKTAAADEAKKKELYEMLDTFGTAMKITETSYVDEVSQKQLIEDAIRGMISARDPHSDFLNEQEYKEFNEDTTGEFGGLGIEVSMDKGVVKVVSPIDDTPAAKAGIMAGDYISHIDGKQVNGLTLFQAIKLMKGKPGTKVKLTVLRKEETKPLEFTLTRAIIKTAAVKSRLQRDNSVAYLRITSFSEKTNDELLKNFKALQKEAATYGGKITGIVLDLRNNPGGLLNQAVKVSNDFLQEGEIVSSISREKNAIGDGNSRSYFAQEGDITNGMPIVVLINGGTASAAEIVSGALQDHRRAIILGTKSFGKGSVQSLIPLEGGKVAIKLTTAKYYTPSGASIQGEGITPDVEVNFIAPTDGKEVKDDRLFTESTLRGSFKNDTSDQDAKKKVKVLSKEEQKVADQDMKDYQLQRSLDLLTALVKINERPNLDDLKKENSKKREDAKAKLEADKKAEK